MWRVNEWVCVRGLCVSGEYGKVKDRSAPPCFTLFTTNEHKKVSFKYNSGFHLRVMCFIFLVCVLFFSLFASTSLLHHRLLNCSALPHFFPPLISSSIFNLFVHFYFTFFAFRITRFWFSLCFAHWIHTLVSAFLLASRSLSLYTQQHFSDYDVLHTLTWY